MGLVDFLRKLFGGGPTEPPLPPPDVGQNIAELARRLGLSAADLQTIRPDYHQFTISRRNGQPRLITAPGADFKAFQQRLLHRLLGRLAVHPAATGFEKGESIVTNALFHAFRPVVVKMDIRDFFASTTDRRVHDYFRRIGWNEEAATLLTKWTTHEGGLPQGAPTSPKLSNLVNYRLDQKLYTLAANCRTWMARNPKTLEPVSHADTLTDNVVYTRYADDITFSFPSDRRWAVQGVIHATKWVVATEGYTLHTRKKLRIMRRHDRQIITGLVVNQGVRLPRKVRRRLRAIEHHLATGRPATLTPAQLQGWRALQKMIEKQAMGTG